VTISGTKLAEKTKKSQFKIGSCLAGRLPLQRFGQPCWPTNIRESGSPHNETTGYVELCARGIARRTRLLSVVGNR